MLIGGSTVVTLAYLTTLYFSVEAFGGGLPFATVGAVYLVGSAVATAAPTPGGLGAMEAALIGGLVAAGLDNTDRRARRVHVPAVHVLDPDPARLVQLPLAPTPRVHLTATRAGVAQVPRMAQRSTSTDELHIAPTSERS